MPARSPGSTPVCSAGRSAATRLGIFFWGRTWTLAARCELRQDFRNFRLDRVSGAPAIADPFDEEPGKTLRDMLARYGRDAVRLLDA